MLELRQEGQKPWWHTQIPWHTLGLPNQRGGGEGRG